MLQKQREPSTVLQKQREHYPAMENESSAGCKSHLQVETVRPHVHLVCSLFHVVCVYLVVAIDSIVQSLAFECIGVALFAECGGPFLTVRCVGHAA